MPLSTVAVHKMQVVRDDAYMRFVKPDKQTYTPTAYYRKRPRTNYSPVEAAATGVFASATLIFTMPNVHYDTIIRSSFMLMLFFSGNV